MGGGNAVEDDDREYPVGVLLVGGGAVGDHVVEPFALLARGHDGSGLTGAVAEFVALDLDVCHSNGWQRDEFLAFPRGINQRRKAPMSR